MDQDDWIRPPKSGEVNNNTSVIIANDESKKTSTRTKTNRGIRRRSSLRVLGSSRTRSGCVFKTRASKATSQSNSSVSFSSFSSQPSFSSSSLTAKRRRQRPAIRGYDTIIQHRRGSVSLGANSIWCQSQSRMEPRKEALKNSRRLDLFRFARLPEMPDYLWEIFDLTCNFGYINEISWGGDGDRSKF